MARRLGVLAVAALLLAACADGLETPDSAAASWVLRVAKVGKLAQGPVLLKSVDEAGLARSPASDSRELSAIVAGLQTVLAARPGMYAPTTADVLDNATLAAQNANPNYGEMLATWGRQTGYMAAFELQEGGEPGLLRASVILSRYRAADGARAAYQYVVRQQSQTARRLDLQTPAGGRAPWDEAIVFYQETTVEGRAFGQYTFIFRLNTLIGFVTNVGVAGAVSTRDTADLAQAVLERLRGL
jgi:hypothetical protein